MLRIRDVSLIPDPNIFSIPDPRSAVRIKEFKYLTQKLFLSSRQNDPGCSSQIRFFYPSRIRIRNTVSDHISVSLITINSVLRIQIPDPGIWDNHPGCINHTCTLAGPPVEKRCCVPAGRLVPRSILSSKMGRSRVMLGLSSGAAPSCRCRRASSPSTENWSFLKRACISTS